MIFRTIEEFYPQIKQINTKGMGLDHGLKKTGIALTDVALTMAMPVCVIKTLNQEVLMAKIGSLIKQYEVGFLIVGFPDKQYDATPYERFAKTLSNNFGLAIYLQDETLSSTLANEMMIESGIKRKKYNKIDDHISAQIILESFLDKMRFFLKNQI